MNWTVKYNPCGSDQWKLNFPPQFMDYRGEFSEHESMAVVLAEAIEMFLTNLDYAKWEGIL